MPDHPLALALQGKRVAIFSHTHPSLTKGGAEIAAHTLFTGLRRIGVDAILIAACEEGAAGRISLGPHEFALTYNGLIYDHFYHIAAPSVRRSLVDLLLAQRVDILNAHHFLHIGLGAFADVADAGIEVVFTIHEFLAICHNHGQLVTRTTQSLCTGPAPGKCRGCYPEYSRQQFAIRQQVVTDALYPVAAFVSPSRFLADKMLACNALQSSVSVIENGVAGVIDVPIHRRDAQRRIWKFGYFGQINPFKGMDVLLDACSVLAQDEQLSSRIRINVHGNFVGQSEEFVRRFTEAVKDYPFLSYLGPYENGEVNDLMSGCDYVVMPSKWWENSPVVIQEAYRAQVPVICTGIGGMAEKVVDGVSGLHFARNDAADLADRILEAADPVLHARLRSGLPVPSTIVEMAERYAALFTSVLSLDQTTAAFNVPN